MYTPSPGVTLSWKDTKYFDALERGDMDTVQRMIDEKAEDEDFVEAEREGRRVFLSLETGKLKAADQGERANKVVFALGMPSNPIINKVIEVDRRVVDNVSDYVEGVIRNERYGIDFVSITESFEDEKVFRTYRIEDFSDFKQIQRK